MKDKKTRNEIQNLIIDYTGEKKEEETFDSKMDSLFNQLDESMNVLKECARKDEELNLKQLEKIEEEKKTKRKNSARINQKKRVLCFSKNSQIIQKNQ